MLRNSPVEGKQQQPNNYSWEKEGGVSYVVITKFVGIASPLIMVKSMQHGFQ